MDQDAPRLTALLQAWSGGDGAAGEAVMSLVYDRIRQLAARRLRLEPRAALQPTELANELVLNLLEADVAWQDRAHFFRTVAVALRNILHDVARRRAAGKRGGGAVHVTLGAAAAEAAAPESREAEELHETLLALRELDSRKADVIELHYLVGLGLEEVARVLGVSLPTVNRDLRFARAWMRERLSA